MSELITARARPILLPVGEFGEILAVAVVGFSEDGIPFARVASNRLLKCLPPEVGHACHSFGAIVVSDFMARYKTIADGEAWVPPLGGLQSGEWLQFDGFDVDSIADRAIRMCSLFTARNEDQPGEVVAPRTSDEARFLEQVKTEVSRRRPGLKGSFRRHFSLTGKDIGGEIDFVGSRYATCYAAINPRSKPLLRIQTASAALWRLARARDAFGFAAPESVELTAWVPPLGQPIFTDREYAIVDEAVAELREQAKRERIGVFTATEYTIACERLMSVETSEESRIS
ncbi:MAG: hypothetical protein ACKVQA_05695 [Burkholderiales bacterium]